MANNFDLLAFLGIDTSVKFAEPEPNEAVTSVIHPSCATDNDRLSEGSWGTNKSWEFRCDRCDGAPSPRMVGVLELQSV